MSAPEISTAKAQSFLRRALVMARRGVDHQEVADAVYDNGGVSSYYLVMTAISAAIAILGLMLNSPAVVIGAMLVSPMMGPIVALGFSLALLDLDEMKRAAKALLIGIALALSVAIVLTWVSPLKEPTTEILARTRPNFFDLLVAVFSGIAGAYAVIRQRGDTIIGVAIATALMPPVATVAFGLGNGDMRIAIGASYLFMTNLVAIALAATLTAGYYGFRPRLMERKTPWRGLAVMAVFVILSIPLVLSLRSISLESRAMAETRVATNDIFSGADSRVTLVDARAHDGKVVVSTLISTRTLIADAQARLQDRLTAALHVPVEVTLDQIVVADPEAAARAVQASSNSSADAAAALSNRLKESVPFATDAIMVDSESHKAIILLRPDAGLDLSSAYALEQALRRKFEGMDVWVTPPLAPLSSVDLGEPQARTEAIWALARWRASPHVRFCRPAAAPVPTTPPAEGQNPPQDARESFLTDLVTAGVSIAGEDGPACRGGDRNLARLSLA